MHTGVDGTEINDKCLEDLIQKSKRQWTELSVDSDGDSIYMDFDEFNLAIFMSLQTHPKWGTFFVSFGHGEDSVGELMVGKKFAEGAQAELFEVEIKWQNPETNEQDLRNERKYMLKAFKKGFKV